MNRGDEVISVRLAGKGCLGAQKQKGGGAIDIVKDEVAGGNWWSTDFF
jgi:hypothetical protein